MQRMFCATGQEQTIQDEESQGLASQAEARLDRKANEDEMAREQALARLRLRLRGKHQPPYVPTAPGGLRTVCFPEICLSFFCLPILLVTLVLLSCVRSELATAVRDVGRRLAEANPQVAPRIGVTERAWQSDLGEIERLCGCVNINL